jgi:mono/diheme cytochrome c family protein
MFRSRSIALFSAFMLTTGFLSAQQQPTPSPTPAPGGAAAQGSGARATAGNVERGRYIVERVANCGECHSQRDGRGNIVQGTKFQGGSMVVNPSFSIDWPNRFPRIAGLPGYTDEQAIRLLTQGAIKRDGTQLRAPMPRFRMTPEDAAAVIAYLRSL